MSADLQQQLQAQRQAAKRPLSRLSQLQLTAVKKAGVRTKKGTALTTDDLKLPGTDRYITPEASELSQEEAKLWIETDHIAVAEESFDDLMSLAQSHGAETEEYQTAVQTYIGKQAAAFSQYEFQVEKAKHAVETSRSEIERLENEKGYGIKYLLGFNKAQDKAIEVQRELLNEQTQKLNELSEAKEIAEKCFDNTMSSLHDKNFATARDNHAVLSANLTTKFKLPNETLVNHVEKLQKLGANYENVAKWADRAMTVVGMGTTVAMTVGAIVAGTLLTPVGAGLGLCILAGLAGGALVYGVGGAIIKSFEAVYNATTTEMSFGQSSSAAFASWKKDLWNIPLNGLPAGLGARAMGAIARYGKPLGLFKGIATVSRWAISKVSVRAGATFGRYAENLGSFAADLWKGAKDLSLSLASKVADRPLISAITRNCSAASAYVSSSGPGQLIGKAVGGLTTGVTWCAANTAKLLLKIPTVILKSSAKALGKVLELSSFLITGAAKTIVNGAMLITAPARWMVNSAPGTSTAAKWTVSQYFKAKDLFLGTAINRAKAFVPAGSKSEQLLAKVESSLTAPGSSLTKLKSAIAPEGGKVAGALESMGFSRTALGSVAPQVTRDVAESQALWNARVFGGSSSITHNLHEIFWNTEAKEIPITQKNESGEEVVVGSRMVNVPINRPELADKSIGGKLAAIIYEATLDTISIDLSARYGINAALKNETAGIFGRTLNNTIGGTKAMGVEAINTVLKSWNLDILFTDSYIEQAVTRSLVGHVASGQIMNEAIAAERLPGVARYGKTNPDILKTSRELQNRSDLAPIREKDGSVSKINFRVKTSAERTPSDMPNGRVLPFESALDSPGITQIVDDLAKLNIDIIATTHIDGKLEIPSALYPKHTRTLTYDTDIKAPLRKYLESNGIQTRELESNTTDTYQDVSAAAIAYELDQNPDILLKQLPKDAHTWGNGLNDNLVDFLVKNMNAENLQKYALRTEPQNSVKDRADEIHLSEKEPSAAGLADLNAYLSRSADIDSVSIKELMRADVAEVYGNGRRTILVDANRATYEKLSELFAQVSYEHHAIAPAKQLAQQWGQSWSGLGDFAKQLSTEQRQHISMQPELHGLNRILDIISEKGLGANEPYGTKLTGANQTNSEKEGGQPGLKSTWSEAKRYFVNQAQAELNGHDFEKPILLKNSVFESELQINNQLYSNEKIAENLQLEEARKYFKSDDELTPIEKARIEELRFPHLRRAENKSVDTTGNKERTRQNRDQLLSELKPPKEEQQKQEGTFVKLIEDNILTKEKSRADRTLQEEIIYNRTIKTESSFGKLSESEQFFLDRAKYDRAPKIDPTSSPAEQAKAKQDRLDFVAERVYQLTQAKQGTAQLPPEIASQVVDKASAKRIAQDMLNQYDAIQSRPRDAYHLAKNLEDSLRLTKEEQTEYQQLIQLAGTSVGNAPATSTQLGRNNTVASQLTSAQHARLVELESLRAGAEKAAVARHKILHDEAKRGSGHMRSFEDMKYDEMNEIMNIKARTTDEVRERPNYDRNAWRSHLGKLLNAFSPFAGSADDIEEAYKARWWLQSQMKRLSDWSRSLNHAPEHLFDLTTRVGFLASSGMAINAVVRDEEYTLLHGMMHDKANQRTFGMMMYAQEAHFVHMFRRMMSTMGDNDEELEKINSRWDINRLTPNDDRTKSREISEEEYNKGWLFVAPGHHQKSGTHYTQSAEALKNQGFFTPRMADIHNMLDVLTARPEAPLFGDAEKAQTTLNTLLKTDPLYEKYIEGYDWEFKKIVRRDPNSAKDPSEETVDDFILIVPASSHNKDRDSLVFDQKSLNFLIQGEVSQHFKQQFAQAQNAIIPLFRELPRDHWLRDEVFNDFAWDEAQVIENDFGGFLSVPRHSGAASMLEGLIFPNKAKPLILSLNEIGSLIMKMEMATEEFKMAGKKD